MKIGNMLLCIGVCLGAAGCSSETGAVNDVDDETVGEVSEAMFQTGCGFMQPDATIFALNDPQWSDTGMPLVRDTCGGSRVLNVYKFQEGEDVGVNGVHIGLADPPALITKTECERLWLGTSVYENITLGWTHLKDTSTYGSWKVLCPTNGPPSSCIAWCAFPSVTYYSSVKNGHTYRFVASAARHINKGDPWLSPELKKVTINARVTN